MRVSLETKKREKVAHDFEPVFTMIYVEEDGEKEEYTHFHVFQSMSSCYFATINTLVLLLYYYGMIYCVAVV